MLGDFVSNDTVSRKKAFSRADGRTDLPTRKTETTRKKNYILSFFAIEMLIRIRKHGNNTLGETYFVRESWWR